MWIGGPRWEGGMYKRISVRDCECAFQVCARMRVCKCVHVYARALVCVCMCVCVCVVW